MLHQYLKDHFDEASRSVFLKYRELHLKTFDTRMDPVADGTKTLYGAIPTVHPERKKELLKSAQDAGEFICAEWTKPHRIPANQAEIVAALR